MTEHWQKYRHVHPNIMNIEYDSDFSGEIYPANTSVSHKVGRSQPKNLVIGTYCYLRRSYFGRQTNKNKTIDVNSYCEERGVIITKLIRNIQNGSLKLSSISGIGHFFDWVDFTGRSNEITDSWSSAKVLYRDYTQSLINEYQTSSISGKKHLNRSSASIYQRNAMSILGVIWDVRNADVMNWASVIPTKQKSSNLPTAKINNNDIQNAFTSIQILFNTLVEHLTKPIITSDVLIPYSKIGFEDKYFFDEPHHIRDLPISSKFKHCRLLNVANMCFYNLLMGATGSNFEVISTVDFSAKNLGLGMNQIRTVGIKERDGGKKKYIEINNRFTYMWSYGQKLTQLCRELTENNTIDRPVSIRFFKQKYRHVAPSSSNIRNSIAPILPNNVAVPITKDWRKFKGISVLEATNGNVDIAADILGNSKKTVQKHYAYAHLEESAKELNPFFDKLDEWADHYVNNPRTPAPIFTNATKSNTGCCNAKKPEDAKLIDGFDEKSPKPNCGADVTCFFCEHYGIHATPEDITVILATKQWLKLQSSNISRNVDEHISKFLPIMERIDVIIEEFSLLSSKHNAMVNEANYNINQGNLPIYWQNKIDALIDSGVI